MSGSEAHQNSSFWQNESNWFDNCIEWKVGGRGDPVSGVYVVLNALSVYVAAVWAVVFNPADPASSNSTEVLSKRGRDFRLIVN